MMPTLRSTDQRTVSLLDGVVVFWSVFWLVLGVLTGIGIWRLSQLSDTAEVSATAVDHAGEALQKLGQLPLIGDTTGPLGGQVRDAAAQIRESAGATRADVRRLSIVLGLSVAAIPVTPVLGVYLPLRLRRRRDTEAIRRTLTSGAHREALEALLAHRAVQTLSLVELLEVTPDPIGDLEHRRHDRLAAAELRRLGLQVPAGDGPVTGRRVSERER